VRRASSGVGGWGQVAGECRLSAAPVSSPIVNPLERALIVTVQWLVPALALSALLLAVPEPDDPFVLFIAQLAAIVAFGVALAVQMTRLVASDDWFSGTGWPPGRRRLAAASTLVALTTGAVALLTLASSAALRLEPSLQFLQLLSALDIAWVGAAIALGSFLRWGTRAAAWISAMMLGVFCVFSIWRYLDIVGFTSAGGWKVSGSDLMRHVIPFDVVAATVAITILWMGAHTCLRTEQARLQS